MTKQLLTFDTPLDKNEIVLICTVWNEAILLPFFIDYYKSIGVTRFIFIDNDSIDGTTEYIISRTDIDAELYVESGSYAEAEFGIKWINEVLNDQLKDMWCIVVDVDEILMFDENMNLFQLTQLMETDNSNILQTVLVDFYPRKFAGEEYLTRSSFFTHSDCFHRFDNTNVRATHAPDGSLDVKGGVRHAIANDKRKPNSASVCLSKKSFFKYDFYRTHKLSVGMHWILPHDFTCWWPMEKAYNNWKDTNKFLRFFREPAVLSHFKYVKPNLKQVFQIRIDRNQDWNNSEEYKKNITYLEHDFWDTDFSMCYESTQQVYKNTLENILL